MLNTRDAANGCGNATKTQPVCQHVKMKYFTLFWVYEKFLESVDSIENPQY